MKICSVCQRCCEDSAADCQENHGSLRSARAGSRQITADYRLDRLLERDAAGETYQAARSGSEQPVVIKIFAANSLDAEQREKIQSETRRAAALVHPNLACVYESGATAGGEFFTASETLDGRTLGECLRKVGALPEAEAVEIAERTAQALAAAHAVGIAHGAVSPANIILVRGGRNLSVRLQNFDFGGVRQQIAQNSFAAGNGSIDVLRYLAPEQCDGQTPDARSDVYSLGVVLYEMLCGRSPFGAPTAAAIADRRINEQPLEQLGFDTRALLKHLLRQSLQKRPDVRPANAGNVARQLRHVEQLLGLPGAISRDAPHAPTANESIGDRIVFNSAAPSPTSEPTPEIIQRHEPTPEIIQPRESAPENVRPLASAPENIAQSRELPNQEIAGSIFPAMPLAAAPVERIEENAAAISPESESNRAANQIAPKAFDNESAAEPILIRKKETNAQPNAPTNAATNAPANAETNAAMNPATNAETNDVSFASAPILVRKKSASEPNAVEQKQSSAESFESAPIFVERKKTEHTLIAPDLTAPEAIDLPAADVREEKRVESAAPIFAGSHGASRSRTLPPGRAAFVGAGLLALLVSVLLGALLYKRQHQSSAAPPIAQASPQTTVAASENPTESDIAEPDRTKTEKRAPNAIEKSTESATAKRENQSRETAPNVGKTTVPNDAPEKIITPNDATKTRAARPNPAEVSGGETRARAADGGAQTELNTSLADWVTATNTRNVDRQMSYYAPQVDAYYQTRNVSPNQVRAEKRRVFERAEAVDIQTGKPEIAVSPDGKSATMRFRKKYVIKEGGRSRGGEVVQELRWVKSGGGWRIVSERDLKVINR